jgi:cytochrome c oxidase cbb3-type subunit 3
MTTFWSVWITVISLACWASVTGVLIFVLRMKPTLEEDGTTGHVYDGIREYDKPMPRWWLVVFWASIVFAIGYMAAYPSLGTWKGMLMIERADGSQVHWTSANEMQNDFDRNDAVFMENYKQRFAHQSIEQLSQDPHAVKSGQRLFSQNCAVCHGLNAKGNTGFPNLTDNDWLYGGTTDKIVETLHKGRQGGMPAWQEKLGEDGVKAAAEYVMSLSGRSDLNGELVNEGQKLFKTNCVMCHGAEGKGTQAVGAPNLTDNIWLYGGDRATIRQTLRYGRGGVMPAWEAKLGNERINLLASYVYSLRKKDSH